MPRHARVITSGVPLHITQRGVNRCLTFHGSEDSAYYRYLLGEASADAGCAVHAYVLMTNHVHLLVTPTSPVGPARMMHRLNMQYVRYFNDRHRRTGTLWEGRYYSVIVDSTRYLFACSRYIELNPVRAGMVADPRDYHWSSFAGNACGDEDELITLHPQHAALGADPGERARAYRAFFQTELDPGTVAAIRARRRGPLPLQAGADRQLTDSPDHHAGVARLASVGAGGV